MATRAEVDVALRDGSTVHVRPATPGDVEALLVFLQGLSTESRWFRFFTAGVDLAAMARWCAGADGSDGDALVVTTGADGRIVGHARYALESPERAEIAFATGDAWQGKGIATILLAHLAQLASARGVCTFTATVLPENHRMIRVFRDSGFAVAVRSAPDALELTMPTELDAAARARFEDRDRLAAVMAVAQVLRPASVAVVGASRREGALGRRVLESLVTGGFPGAVHAVNLHADEVGGHRAHRRVADVPGPPDLAILAVPAPEVVAVARECAAVGVRALVVLSAGFAERGEDGRVRQDELLRVCREGGMRLVGPNSLGVLNTAPDVRLAALVDGPIPPAGRVAFASQSGAFGIAALEEACERPLGISSFVSLGNKADLSGNDMLQYWEQDDATDVVLLYLESFGNPQKFGAITRRLARRKPVAIVKSARTAAGARAAASHTGALLGAGEEGFDALFAHAGVIRVETLSDLFDVGALLAAQPLPRGDRVAIVTNHGGPGTVCADACVSAGLRVDAPSAATCERLAAVLPARATPANPVDLDAPAAPGDYRAALDVLLHDDDVDALVAIIARPLEPDPADVAAAVRAAAQDARDLGKPVLAVAVGRLAAPEAAAGARDGGVPSYPAPEEAARALGHARRYARHRERPAEEPQVPADVDADAAAAVVARALAGGGGWLPPAEAEELFRAYGIPVLWSRVVDSAAAVGRAAAEAATAVAVKAVAPEIPHKADVGAVLLDVQGATEATRAAREVAAALVRLGREQDGYVVQTMAPTGVEMLVGVTADPRFGPIVACGAGGPAMELLHDVQVRLAPLGPHEARTMIQALRTLPLLQGHRGAPPVDLDALVDVLVRVAALAAAHPEVAEVDCHPVIAWEGGAVVADSRVRVDAPPPPGPFPSLAS